MSIGEVLDAAAGLRRAGAARVFAGAGIPVFPCVVGGKRPLTQHGFLDASTDHLVIDTWWVAHPEANIGIPTGAASGVEVVDVDVHAQVDGFVELGRAQRAGFMDDWAALVLTPSGGMHAYFPVDRSAPAQPSWQSARAGIDFRGDRGYVIAPPSAADGRAYELLAIARDEPAPVRAGELREFLDPKAATAFPPTTVQAAHDLDVERIARWVAARREGERNHGLFWAACRLAEGGLDLPTAVDALGPAAESAGLPEREIRVTIQSAYRTVSTAPVASAPEAPAPSAPEHQRSSAAREVIS